MGFVRDVVHVDAQVLRLFLLACSGAHKAEEAAQGCGSQRSCVDSGQQRAVTAREGGGRATQFRTT